MLLFELMLLIVAISVVLGILGKRERKVGASSDSPNVFESLAGGGAVIAVIIFATFSFCTAVGYYDQVYDLENVKQIDSVTAILKQKADDLSGEFAVYLAKEYPNLEREIFKSISPDKVGTYLSFYPQIKSSEAMAGLVNTINKLQSDYYDQRLLREATLRNIRVRLRNPCIITALIPKN